MKVLITTDAYFPMINGVVTSINNLYKQLKKNGHDVKILALSQNGEEEIIGDVYYLKSFSVRVYPNARVKFPFYNELINELIDWNPDIIHSQTEFSTMLAAKHIAQKTNAPQIHTYHTMYEDYLGYIFGGKLIRKRSAAKITRRLLNSVDAVVVPSHKTEMVLLKYGVHKDIFTVPTGIDFSSFQKEITKNDKIEILTKLGAEESSRVICFVGRIAEEKHISEIITLFKDVLNKRSDVVLLIAGGGPYLEDLKSQVKQEAIEENVLFTGMVKPEEIYKYYKISDIFVTASTSETQGLTYVEAMGCGCPIVCRWDLCLDGIIIQGRNGYFYKENYEFAMFVLKILEDNELRKSMSIEAHNLSKKYSIDIFGEKIVDVYLNVLGKKSINNIYMSYNVFERRGHMMHKF